MSELYRSPTGLVERLEGKKCADCIRLCAGPVSSNPLVGQRYTCLVSGIHVTLSTYACPLYAKVNGWTKLELVTLNPLKEEPVPAL